ncbi:hypothetical protein QQ045_015016 [Rhodiola kirilowii]
MRAKVRMQVDQPLLKGTYLFRPYNKAPIWITFRYEKLPNFYPYRGVLTHRKKSCLKERRPTDPIYYKSSLKAESGLIDNEPQKLIQREMSVNMGATVERMALVPVPAQLKLKLLKPTEGMQEAHVTALTRSDINDGLQNNDDKQMRDMEVIAEDVSEQIRHARDKGKGIMYTCVLDKCKSRVRRRG